MEAVARSKPKQRDDDREAGVLATREREGARPTSHEGTHCRGRRAAAQPSTAQGLLDPPHHAMRRVNGRPRAGEFVMSPSSRRAGAESPRSGPFR